MQPLKIIRIVEETKDAKTFVLQAADEQPLLYKEGQFVTLVFETRFGEKRRSYSISSSLAMDEPLSITIKRVANGEFSRLLLSHAKEGDTLNSSGISGQFVLPRDAAATDQFFFLAAGSGITPCFSIIKNLLVTSHKKLVLIYSNRSKADCIFYNSLLHLRQQYPLRLRIHFLFSDQPDVYHSRLSNWLLQQLLQQYLEVPLSRAMFYLCGPFEFMQMITITLLSEGVAPVNIKKENFSSLPRLTKPVPPDTNVHRVTVNTSSGFAELVVQYPATILAAAKAAKVNIPYSCEAGRCGSCVATCVIGKVWMAYNEVLMDDEIERGRILCCQAYPVGGDVEIVV